MKLLTIKKAKTTKNLSNKNKKKSIKAVSIKALLVLRGFSRGMQLLHPFCLVLGGQPHLFAAQPHW